MSQMHALKCVVGKNALGVMGFKRLLKKLQLALQPIHCGMVNATLEIS